MPQSGLTGVPVVKIVSMLHEYIFTISFKKKPFT